MISYNAFLAVLGGGDQPRRRHLAAVEGERERERAREGSRTGGGGFSIAWDYAGVAGREGCKYRTPVIFPTPYVDDRCAPMGQPAQPRGVS